MVMLKINSLSPYDNGSYKLPNADATKFGRTKGRQRCRILASLWQQANIVRAQKFGRTYERKSDNNRTLSIFKILLLTYKS